MEEFLKKLGIQGKLKKSSNNAMVLDIDGSDNYGRIFSRLDRSDLLEEDEDTSQLTLDTSSIQYMSDEYRITLLADFNTDEYKLVIKEN